MRFETRKRTPRSSHHTGTGKVVMRAVGNTSAAPPPAMLAAPASTVLPSVGQAFSNPPLVTASLPGSGATLAGGLGSTGPPQPQQQAAVGLRGGLDGGLSASGMEVSFWVSSPPRYLGASNPVPA
eukprot:scaffold72302_cov18-Tisochrysis_lutea.AAC.1